MKYYVRKKLTPLYPPLIKRGIGGVFKIYFFFFFAFGFAEVFFDAVQGMPFG